MREALRGLATEGLVTPEVSKGVRVRSAGLQDLEETYSLRVLLDRLAVRLAVARMTEQYLVVAACLEEMRTAADWSSSMGGR